ncbi:MAG: lysophospholipid acyltransferase family protein, partial [Sphingomicrobium sp.]
MARYLMPLIRSLLFSLIFYLGTLGFVILGIVAGAISTQVMLRVINGWAHFHHWLATDLLGIRTEIDGAVPPGPHLIAIKHQSMFETIEMLRVARNPIMVVKRELADLPLFGRLTRSDGIIPVDREAGASALREMLVAAKAATASGRPVVIYPEGT